MKRVLVIIPTYNEARNIGPLVEEIFKLDKKLKAKSLEVLVMDDRSPDRTASVVKDIQKTNKRLHLKSGPKAGLGNAYLRGFKFGLRDKRYSAFVMMDADFSHDPAVIPVLLAALDDGGDYVIGSRYTKGGSVASDWSKLRKLNSRSANLFARIFIGTKNVSDFTAGFKAIRRSALEQIKLENIHAGGYVFQVNLLHEFSRRGFDIREVPITFTSRRHGSSKMRFSDIIEFLYLTYRLNPESRVRRMIRFGLVGVSGTLVNLAVLAALINLAHSSAILADAIAIEASIISNFFLNHYYTFKAAYTSPAMAVSEPARALIAKLAKYNLITLGGAAISFAVFVVTYKWIGLHYIPADIIAILLATGWNYWMSTRVVWKVIDSPINR